MTIYLDRDLMVIGKMENAADAVISSDSQSYSCKDSESRWRILSV